MAQDKLNGHQELLAEHEGGVSDDLTAAVLDEMYGAGWADDEGRARILRERTDRTIAALSAVLRWRGVSLGEGQ